MPRPDYKTCKECGGHTSAVGPLSHTRLCRSCSIAREEQNFDGLKTHTGAAFLHWRRRIAASVGAGLLDEQRSNP